MDGYNTAEPLYCYCHSPESGTMITCGNTDCPFEWLHTKYLNLKTLPKGSPSGIFWTVENCHNLSIEGKSFKFMHTQIYLLLFNQLIYLFLYIVFTHVLIISITSIKKIMLQYNNVSGFCSNGTTESQVLRAQYTCTMGSNNGTYSPAFVAK